MLIKIFIYFLFFTQIFSLCGKGCLRCKNNDCKICDNQQNYILRNNECIFQELDHCLFSTKYDLCEICEEGYFLRRNRKCQLNPVFVIENCMFYNDLITCLICKTGFFLNHEGQCEEIKSETENCLYYNNGVTCDICKDGYLKDTTNNTCKKIVVVENCLLYNNPFTCESCIDRYILNKNSFLKNISDFYTQIVRSKELKLQNRINSELNLPFCERKIQIDFCKTYKNANECSECQKSYYLSSKTECKKNPVSYWTEKDSIVLNCFSFDLSNSCNMCYDGFYLSSQECFKHEETLENCFIRSQSKADSCFICNPNHFISPKPNEVNKLICTQRTNTISFCEEYKIDEDKCSKCLEGFISHFNKTKCSKKINECETYNTSLAVLTCSKCSDLYIPLNGICTKNDNNCIQRQNDLCSRCQKGYSLNKEYVCVNTSADLLAHNCDRVDTSVTDVVKCEVCRNHEVGVVKRGYCVKGDSNCALFGTDGACLECKSGFHYSVSQCVGNLETDGCELYKGLTANCVRCRFSFILGADLQCKGITKASHLLDDFRFCDASSKDYACDVCSAGFFPVKRGNINFLRPVTCQKRSDNAALMENCLFYNNSKCYLCRENYYVNIDWTGCVTTCSANEIINLLTLKCESSTGISVDNCLETDGKSCFACETFKPLLNYNKYNDSFFKLKTTFKIDTSLTKTIITKPNQVENCNNTGSYINLYIDKNFRTVENNWGKYPKIKELRSLTNAVVITYTTLSTCSSSTKYNFTQKDKFYSSLLSCHKCTGLNILKLDLSNGYRITDVGFQDQKFLDGTDQIEITNLTCGTVTGGTNNCAVFSKNIPKEDSSHDCILCKPGFKPTYNSDDVITTCTTISNCSIMTTFNECDKCGSGFAFDYDLDLQEVDKTKCVTAGFCEVYSSVLEECMQCQEGYVYDYAGDECVSVSVKPTGCKSGLNGSHCAVCEDDGSDQGVAVFEIDKDENECVAQNLLPSSMKARNCKIFNDDLSCFSCPIGFFIAQNGSCLDVGSVNGCVAGVVTANVFICEECEIGYSLDIGANSCTLVGTGSASIIPNCRSLENPTSCGECDYGFYLVVQGGVGFCVRGPLPEGCTGIIEDEFKNNNDLYCNACEEGYTFYIESDSNRRNSFCLDPSPKSNCLIMNKDDCLECTSDYYLNNEICEIRTTFTTNCVEYEKTSQTCLRTLESVTPYEYTTDYISPTNYNLLTTTEKLVLQKLPPFRENMGDGIPNCEIYKTASSCQNCKTGYYLKNTKCVPITTSTNECLYYKTEIECEICIENYLLIEKECKKIVALNCEKYKDPSTCETCPKDFPVFNAEGNCERPTENSENCEVFHLKDNKWVCRECVNYHYPDSEGVCRVINFPVENCLKYSSLTNCLKCRNGYVFRQKSLSCEVAGELEPNCDELVLGNSCSVCELGYYLENEICVLCKTNDSCNFCNPMNPEICLVCKSGYYMDNSENCYKNS